MRAKLTLLSALVLSTLGGVLATGCQTYDFEPVEPLAISQTTETRKIEARERKPNLMLLVDTSGSMKEPANPEIPACQNGSGVACGESTFPCAINNGCDTRWSALQKAMTDFLGSSATIARMGLATFPTDDACGSTATITTALPSADQEDDATLTTNAQDALNKLLAIKTYATTTGDTTPKGGTPTGASLRYVGTLADLQTAERSDFVVLLTDGLPNCNEQYPDPYPSTKCFCTLPDGCEYTPDVGCLDKDASVEAVKALRAKEIKTIVIGFGADFSSTSESGRQGAATLNAMATEGDFARKCTQDADCGAGDACDRAAGFCNRRFYQAGNKDELVAALREIGKRVGTGDPCLLTFAAGQAPTSQELVVVYINGERIAPGADTWSLTDDGIKFTGATCQRIQNSTPANPVNLEVRAVQKR